MASLRDDLEALGLQEVRSYVQSGNVVFRVDASARSEPGQLSALIGDAIARRHGFRPGVVVLSASRLDAVVTGCPFARPDDPSARVHVFFLEHAPVRAARTALDDLRASTERLHLTADVLYLDAPDGIGRSRLAGAVERRLGTAATARNWRTVTALAGLSGALHAASA